MRIPEPKPSLPTRLGADLEAKPSGKMPNLMLTYGTFEGAATLAQEQLGPATVTEDDTKGKDR
jgi:hypothetical protein